MRKPPPIADVVMHPVRLRIIQQIGGGRRTTAELRAALPDVAQATLYRHVAALVDAGVLAVVDERRVRGTTERTLALGERGAQIDRAELAEMDALALQQAFLAFLASLGEQFDRVNAAAEPGIRDFLGFGTTQLHVGTAELADIQAGLAQLLAPYREAREGTRPVHLSTVLLPEPGAADGPGASPAP